MWWAGSVALPAGKMTRALSGLALDARPGCMNDTEVCLYWATESWLEKDVARETGLPPEMCTPMWAEIERVRALFRDSIKLPVLPSGAR